MYDLKKIQCPWPQNIRDDCGTSYEDRRIMLFDWRLTMPFHFYSKLPARFTSRLGNIFHSWYKFTARNILNSSLDYESCHYSMCCTTEVIENKMSDFVLSWSLTSRYHRWRTIIVTQTYLSCTCLWRLLPGTGSAVIFSWIDHASGKGISGSLAIYNQSYLFIKNAAALYHF